MNKYKTGPDVNLDKTVVRDRHGKRITEADAAQIAEKTLRKVGRPSLSGGTQHSPQVSFRATDQLRTKAQAKADAEGLTVSELARRALERYVS